MISPLLQYSANFTFNSLKPMSFLTICNQQIPAKHLNFNNLPTFYATLFINFYASLAYKKLIKALHGTSINKLPHK